MGIKKQIHISDMEVYNHIQSQPNHSQYIVRLVRADMQDSRVTKQDVIRLIEQYTGHKQQEPAVGNSIRSLLNL